MLDADGKLSVHDELDDVDEYHSRLDPLDSPKEAAERKAESYAAVDDDLEPLFATMKPKAWACKTRSALQRRQRPSPDLPLAETRLPGRGAAGPIASSAGRQRQCCHAAAKRPPSIGIFAWQLLPIALIVTETPGIHFPPSSFFASNHGANHSLLQSDKSNRWFCRLFAAASGFSRPRPSTK